MSPPHPDPLAFMSAFGLFPPDYPDEYWAAVDTISSSALVRDFYARPRAKVSILEGAHGSKLVRPPYMRLVSESDHMARHVDAAAALPSGVQPEFSENAPPDLIAAVRLCVREGHNLPDWRARQLSLIESVEESLRPFAAVVSGFMGGSSAAIASHVNLPFMAAVVCALAWPDHQCVRRWFYGHQIVGDIPDTGLFRPHLVDFAAPQSTLSPPSNRHWNRYLDRSMAASGAAAASDPVKLAVLVGVESATRKEVSAGAVRGPLKPAQLDKLFGTVRTSGAGNAVLALSKGSTTMAVPKSGPSTTPRPIEATIARVRMRPSRRRPSPSPLS